MLILIFFDFFEPTKKKEVADGTSVVLTFGCTKEELQTVHLLLEPTKLLPPSGEVDKPKVKNIICEYSKYHFGKV